MTAKTTTCPNCRINQIERNAALGTARQAVVQASRSAELMDEIDLLRDALDRAAKRFELFADGGVGMTLGACPRVGAQEARHALKRTSHE